MRARRLSSGLAAVGLAVLAIGCSDDDPGATLPSTTSAATVVAGPVAATELVAGDCVTGLVVGGSERARIESARVVGCDQRHEVEVFTTFELTPEDLGTEETGYPGPQRVVTAADSGCGERLEELGELEDAVGLIAVWPTQTSWEQGDRVVACAIYPLGGGSFEDGGLRAEGSD